MEDSLEGEFTRSKIIQTDMYNCGLLLNKISSVSISDVLKGIGLVSSAWFGHLV